jgi:hypothetical protein
MTKKMARATSSMASRKKLVSAVTVMPLPVTKVLTITKRTIKTQIGIEGTRAFSHKPVKPYRSAGASR